MSYTTEESAIICGMVMSYFNHDSVEQSLRDRYTALCRRVASGDVKRDDYAEILKAMRFISNSRPSTVQDDKTIALIIAKTISLAKT